MQLLGPCLAPDTKTKHLLNTAAAAKQQGPLLGTTPAALIEAHEAKQRKHQQTKLRPTSTSSAASSGHSILGLHALHNLGVSSLQSTRVMMRSFSIRLHKPAEVQLWKLPLRHGSVSDLNDERCAQAVLCCAVLCCAALRCAVLTAV